MRRFIKALASNESSSDGSGRRFEEEFASSLAKKSPFSAEDHETTPAGASGKSGSEEKIEKEALEEKVVTYFKKATIKNPKITGAKDPCWRSLWRNTALTRLW